MKGVFLLVAALPVLAFGQKTCKPFCPIFEKKTLIFDQKCDLSTYRLVFEDAFDGPLDTSVWATTFPYGCPAERIHPMSPDVVVLDKNTVCEGGFLKLKARREPVVFECSNERDERLRIQKNFSSSVLHSKNSPSAAGRDHPSGCWRWGRFAVRAKIPFDGGADGLWPSFWFFGWPGEIDVFEFIHGSDKLETTVWLHNLQKNGRSPKYSLDDQRSEFSTDFHVFELEWTPFKFVFSIDGKPYGSVFRYYQKQKSAAGEPLGLIRKRGFLSPFYGQKFIGLDCDGLPAGRPIEVFENKGWEKYEAFSLDLILGLTVQPALFKADSAEMTVDWVRIWQKQPLDSLIAPQRAVVGQPFDAELSLDLIFPESAEPLPPVVWKIDGETALENGPKLRTVFRSAGEKRLEARIENRRACAPSFFEFEKTIQVEQP